MGKVMRQVTVSLEQATSILGATTSLLGWEDIACTSAQRWKSSRPVLPLGPSASLWGLVPGHERIVCPDEKPDRHTLHVHHVRRGLSSGAPFSGYACPRPVTDTSLYPSLFRWFSPLSVWPRGWGVLTTVPTNEETEVQGGTSKPKSISQEQEPSEPFTSPKAASLPSLCLFWAPLEGPQPGGVPGNGPMAHCQKGAVLQIPFGPYILC